MSRIQDILSKAERDGTTRRTRPLTDGGSPRQPVEEAPAPRVFGDVPRAPRALRGDAGQATARAFDHAPDPETDTPAVTLSRQELAGGSTPAASYQLDELLVTALAPTSLAAEQYRSLRTRLQRAEGGRSLRTIAITSPAKGDGKSLTAANLALTMAQEFQHRVLLIDADLRRPAVHRLFGLGDTVGLGDVLMNMVELDHALVTLPDHHLTLLPAGLQPSNPAELLGSGAMRRVLETLRGRFDRILIDVPPVAPLADLHILSPFIDGLLMIVRAGVTPKPAIERALAGLDASKVLGLVLNESGGERADSANYEGYGYIAG